MKKLKLKLDTLKKSVPQGKKKQSKQIILNVHMGYYQRTTFQKEVKPKSEKKSNLHRNTKAEK